MVIGTGSNPTVTQFADVKIESDRDPLGDLFSRGACMDLSKIRSITNNYRNVRLISLRKWKQASEFEPRDQAGPYVIAQQGYDPTDPKLTPRDFVLGKSGEWVHLQIFFGLPIDTRRQEFIFGTAAEVMELMQNLPGKVKIIRSGEELNEEGERDELNSAVIEAKEQ